MKNELEVTQKIYQAEERRFAENYAQQSQNQTVRGEVQAEVNNLAKMIQKRLQAKAVRPIPVSVQELRSGKNLGGSETCGKLFKFCHDPKAFYKFKNGSSFTNVERVSPVASSVPALAAAIPPLLLSKKCQKAGASTSRRSVLLPPLKAQKSLPAFSKTHDKSLPALIRKQSYFSVREPAAQPNSLKINHIIAQCKLREQSARKHIRASSSVLRFTKEKAESFTRAVQKVSDLEYANPALMEYLYFQRQTEEDLLKRELIELINKPQKKTRRMVVVAAKTRRRLSKSNGRVEGL